MSDGKPPLLPAPHAQTQAGSGRLTRKFIADFDRARKGAAERSAGNKGARASDRDGQRTNSTKVSLTDNFDSELYGNGGGDKFAGYNTELPADEEMEDGDDDDDANGGRLIGQYTATAEQIGEWATGEAAEDDILNSREKQAQIQNRETDYQRKRFQRRLSAGGEGKSYKESMQERDLEREEERVNRAIEDKKKDQIARGEDEMDIDEAKPTLKDGAREESPEAKPRRRARKRGWDVDETETAGEIESNGDGMANGDATEAKARRRRNRGGTHRPNSRTAPHTTPWASSLMRKAMLSKKQKKMKHRRRSRDGTRPPHQQQPMARAMHRNVARNGMLQVQLVVLMPHLPACRRHLHSRSCPLEPTSTAGTRPSLTKSSTSFFPLKDIKS